MSDFKIVSAQNSGAPATTLPAARVPDGDVTVREARLSDFVFIDALQKLHSKAVGFMWEKAIKTRIEQGNVLVAAAGSGEPVGYIIGVDRYFKRDDVGIIYQLNVVPEYQRSLVGAHLLQAKFERSAYGCRLYCCWCAQDLKANRFWEAMGFVPLAFRTGGGRHRGFDEHGNFRGRMHIFWQKRIREGDTGDPATGGTPYWFPSQTGAGAIGEDRLVLPIPPGSSWQDAKPIVLPEGAHDNADEIRLLDDEVARLQKQRKTLGDKKRASPPKAVEKPTAVEAGGLHFGPTPAPAPGSNAGSDQAKRDAETAKRQRAELDAQIKDAKRAARKAKQKFDPQQEAFARELKDRWLEEVQARPALLADLEGHAKYDVRRFIAGSHSANAGSGPLGVRDSGSGVKRLAA